MASTVSAVQATAFVNDDLGHDECSVKIFAFGICLRTISISLRDDRTFEALQTQIATKLSAYHMKHDRSNLQFCSTRNRASTGMQMSSHGLTITEANWEEFLHCSVPLVRATLQHRRERLRTIDHCHPDTSCEMAEERYTVCCRPSLFIDCSTGRSSSQTIAYIMICTGPPLIRIPYP